ncbi:MAG: hypothetical protein NC203_12100 [Firmicutes bacterium]|nr:hypothetical protein [[Eubacterium] siraeum]MCM1489096.1 hypothetical protein [Bacillota bacterium]
MKHSDFNMKTHGFVGHMAEPDSETDKAVIVIMGGEKSILPGIKIAERFADYGFIGLSVSLFGAEGLPDSPDRCPLEMFENAVKYLRQTGKIPHISVYGMSMGSIFAALTAVYVGGIENVILVSPAHVPFEGTTADKKHMTGHSAAVRQGEEIPFVSADFSKVKAMKYQKHPAASHKVTGMWVAYHDAYQDKICERAAFIPYEKTDARILLIAGGADEMWDAEYSVRAIQKYLESKKYSRDFKALVFPNVSHLTGMMPNREREKRLFKMIPIIGLMYKSFGKHKAECMAALERSETEIVGWLNN